MTFSTDSVCETVRAHFTPVWESVSPTTVATFQLGEGKSIDGTIGGEIMLYFCRPDGVVFDALPALQSPAIVKNAIERAAKFYDESGGAPEAAIREYNQNRMTEIGLVHGLTPESAAARVAKAHQKLNERMATDSAPDRALTTSLLSKTIMVAPAEEITVVEPGGLWLYAMQVHDKLAREPFQTPMQWKQVMFEGILDQPLGGGKETYNADSLEPMQLFPPPAGGQ